MYKINSDCNGCGSCPDECPVSAIHPSGDKYTIVAEECTSCGLCVEACPADAIIEE